MGPELLLAFVIASVAMRAGKNGVLDVMHARRGSTPPHHQRAMKRLDLYRGLTSRTGRGQAGSGGTGQVRSGQRRRAALSYFGALWSDSWDDARSAHDRRRTRRVEGQVRPGAARTYARGLTADLWGAWDNAWYRAADRRQARRSDPKGQVKPDPAPDLTPDPGTDPDPDPRPDLGSDPTPDPRSDPGSDPGPDLGTGAKPDLGSDPTPDPGTDPRTGTTDNPPPPAAGDNTGGTTMAGEVTGLRTAIDWAREMQARCSEAGAGGEQAQAALGAGGVGGQTSGLVTQAGEYMRMAAESYGEAADELETHLKVTESYEATNHEAGDKAFVTAE